MKATDLTPEQLAAKDASGNPLWHVCACGYAWEHGKHGGHDHGEYYQERIAELENELSALKENFKNLEKTNDFHKRRIIELLREKAASP